MRSAFLICALALGALSSSPAAAQEDGGIATVRTHVERAPDGSLRRGRLDVPAWVVWAGGGTILLSATAALVVVLLRRR